MARDRFPPEVSEKLKYYVYRLIDPRNGETFYVGKGKGDRIFQHARSVPIEIVSAELGEEDAIELKLQRIKEIHSAGLEVGHVIHQHNIETSEIAFQVEAAVMDAFPGLTNRVGGHGTIEFGVAHVEELIAVYAAQVFEPAEPLILISIAKSFDEEGRSIYDATRGVWKIDPKRAAKVNLVLAHRKGLVVGAFRPTKWLPATKENFAWLTSDMPGRWGFDGIEAEPSTAPNYLSKRVPDRYRRKGAANPVRFVEL